jgi:hypothetical protein
MGRISLIVGLLFLMLSDASAATTVDDGSFGTIFEVFKAWISGSLGYVIALLGSIGSLITYMLHFMGTNKGWSFLLSAIFFSCLVGGAVGIAETMAGLGRGTFG